MAGVVAFGSLLQSCFTGIESTPKITYRDVQRQQVEVTPEQRMSALFQPDSIASWHSGRRFKVLDDRSNLSYVASGGSTVILHADDTLRYAGVRPLRSIMGGEVAEILFVKGGNDTLTYRVDASAAQLLARSWVPLPFLVDLDLVEKVERQLKGKTLYTRSNRWIDDAWQPVEGRKFERVTVVSVAPGKEDYPFVIHFKSDDTSLPPGAMAVAMAMAEGVPSLRGFENLFFLDDPRKRYPNITREHWDLICRGRVTNGMTAAEATLALGNPKEVDRRHDQSLLYERWSYPSGIYLIFENGVLVRHNQ